MSRRTSPQPAQLALEFKRETAALPISGDPTALLQAIADLLLGALGEQAEARPSATHAQGGTDEPEDHA
ncbi:MAG: hypothetical protein AB7F78_26860 [Hyphomicrobiaceae bacterium]